MFLYSFVTDGEGGDYDGVCNSDGEVVMGALMVVMDACKNKEGEKKRKMMIIVLILSSNKQFERIHDDWLI